MAGLLAYAAAGAAAGLGKGLVEQAEMARRDAIEAARIAAEERMQGRRIEAEKEEGALTRAQGTTLQASAQAHDSATLDKRLAFEGSQRGADRDLEAEMTYLKLDTDEKAQVRQIEAAQGTAAANRALDRYRIEVQRDDNKAERDARATEGQRDRDARAEEISAERSWQEFQRTRDGLTGAQERAFLTTYNQTLKTAQEQYADDPVGLALEAAKRAAEGIASIGKPRGGLVSGGQGAAGDSLPQPKSQGEYATLPSGTRYIAPDGSVRVKP